MINAKDIKSHAKVEASCGSHVGMVDHLEGENMIKLTRSDPESGGAHHLIPLSWVAKVEDDRIVLNKNKQEVFAGWKSL